MKLPALGFLTLTHFKFYSCVNLIFLFADACGSQNIESENKEVKIKENIKIRGCEAITF